MLPLALVSGVGLMYVFTTNTQPRTQPPRTLPATTDVATPQVLHGKPVRLIIPSLGIDADVTHLGLTSDGDMDSPTKLMDTGWYKYGSHPGDSGSAVIAGHIGGSQAPGIFIDLHKLKKGDQVSTIDDKGLTVTFTVRESRTYSQDGQPDEVFRGKGGNFLNLITCTGTWLDGQKTFSERLVVFAEK